MDRSRSNFVAPSQFITVNGQSRQGAAGKVARAGISAMVDKIAGQRTGPLIRSRRSSNQSRVRGSSLLATGRGDTRGARENPARPSFGTGKYPVRGKMRQ